MLGQILFYRFDDVAHLPHEDSRVPEKFAATDELLSQFEVGLLGEALDFRYRTVVRLLYVAVAGFGTARRDADGHECVVAVGEVYRIRNYFAERRLVQHEVVGRRHYHHRFGSDFVQIVGGVADARRGVATDRLA